jgi:hypothetical protein
LTPIVQNSSTDADRIPPPPTPPAARLVTPEVRLGPTSRVRITELRSVDSPRTGGVDYEHIRMLAELDEALPPILVRHADMRIIDGTHRVAAARLRGDVDIEVRFFHGTSEEAFRLAVQQNVTHGLPLTMADRQIAAERIILANPEHSDRSLAKTTGLAAKTIAAVRRRILDGAPQPARIGRDGRVRPLSTVEGRLIASQAIAERPDASLRDIARIAGISVGTVRDVRDRLRSGLDPIPPQQRGERGPGSAAPDAGWRPRPIAQPVDIDSLLEGLRSDPSLRYTETGREFLRWLGMRIPRGASSQDLSRQVPPHSGVVVAKIARECSRIWLEFAEEMDRLSDECA